MSSQLSYSVSQVIFRMLNNIIRRERKFITNACSPLMFILLTSCADRPSSQVTHPPRPQSSLTVSSVQGAQKSGVSSPVDKIEQCNSDLAALQKVDPEGYSRYRTAMDQLVSTGRRYMAIQETISQDINDLLQPRYQFGMANLCWQIRNSLSNSLLDSVNHAGGMTQDIGKVNHGQ